MKTHVAVGGGRHRGLRNGCRRCGNAYNRKWRAEHPVTEAQRQKDIARSFAGVYKKRGKLKPQPCEKCGSKKVEMHHDDYSKPLEVRWFCRSDHLAYHRKRWVLAEDHSNQYQFVIPLPAGSVDVALHH